MTIFSKQQKKENNNIKLTLQSQLYGGLIGLTIGDALGVPVEFRERKFLDKNPIIDMQGHGLRNLPPGTWSDDSSLTFCLTETLCEGFNLDDLAKRHCDWLYNGYWTADGYVFDVGGTTLRSINNLRLKHKPELAGESEEENNGNGSLMRILPIAYYLKSYEGDKFELIEKASAISHGHIRSKIACGIYVEYVMNLLDGYSPKGAYNKMQKTILEYYIEKGFGNELKYFNRILKKDISKLSRRKINSGGYAVDTLEASLWCFLTTNNYKDAVLKAVNLGDDADTTGAVTGGLAGCYYGYDNIPSEWVNALAKKEDILDLCERFVNSLNQK